MEATDHLAHDQVAGIYQARMARFSAERDTLDRTSAANANVNVALFAAALASFVAGFWRGERLWFWLAALLAIGFVVAYRRHGGIDRQLRRARELVAISREGVARRARDWEHIPLRGPTTIATTHPFAGDLDVFGKASLQHLLSTVATPAGQDTLRSWLLHPAPPATVAARQAAVRELAPEIAWRDEIYAQGRLAGDTRHGYLEFARWAEQPLWLVERRWLIAWMWIAPPITVGLLIAQLNGVIHLGLWLLLVAVNAGIMYSVAREANARVDEVAERYEVFRAYADLFGMIADRPATAPLLRSLRERLLTQGVSAAAHMQQLGRIMPWADFRRWYFFPIIQGFTLWNLHVLWWLERWQRAAGHQVRDWLDAQGEVEALSALATLAFDHPNWVMPEMDDQGTRITGKRVGHPLIAPDHAVGNAIAIGPTGTFALVTGSNMSGKSTLLRAIGTNVILAQMGAPVSASAFSLPPIALATSIRIQDSLEQGVSYFMAELQRLKLVVTTVEASQSADTPLVLYLLDEILHGTNTRERQIAARAIIRHLLTLRAIGAVSTHDLTLADVPDLAEASRPIHFSETFALQGGRRVMTFDYLLRPGLATSSNALALMEMVGLPLGEDQLIEPRTRATR